ncbi:bifunctional diguanylate cyclase/phosphodiesterase [Comamonas guangdongensis]|uniref:EAL domain-containing protein n=1 Tax=Comamonas guangdongensis TaxID=510515 RepID=A0ABV3ZU33_9BURK
MQQRLLQSADMAERVLQERLDAYTALLQQLAERMGDNADEGQQVFAQHAHHLLSEERLAGLKALSLTRVVEQEGSAELPAGMQAFEVSYVWPLIGNEALAGTNARQPEEAWNSLMSAWRSRSMSISAPFSFLQLPDSPLGVIVRAPLFPGQHQAGAQENSTPVPPLLGTVNARIRLQDLVRGLVPAEAYPHVAMRLLDLGPAAPGRAQKPVQDDSAGLTQTMYTGHLWADSESDPEFELAKPLERQMRVYDRVWVLQFKPALNSQAWVDKSLPWAVLVLGMLAGLALAAWLSGWWQSRSSWLRSIRSSTQARQESDARFHAMCEQAAFGVVEVDLASRAVVKANQHYCRLLGYSQQELLQCNVLEMVQPEDRARCARFMDGLDLEQFHHSADEFSLRAKNGSLLWVELSAFLSGPLDARHLLVLVRDISGRKRLEQMERQGHQQLRDLMQRLPVGLVMEDLDGRFVYWNDEFLRLAGQAGQPDSHGLQWWQRMYPDAAERERVMQRWQAAQAKARLALDDANTTDLAAAAQDWNKSLADSAASMIEPQEMLLTGGDGQRRAVALSGVVQADGCLMVLQDQSQRKAAEREVRRLAFYDALTDLPNRRLMADRLQQALAMGLRRQHFGGVVLLDVDNFKAFNEAFGLEQGDLLLKGLSQRIQALLPPGATIARQGGDDFVLLLDDLGGDPVAAAARLEHEAERWMTALREPMEIAGTPRQITVSMGLSLFGGQELRAEEVLRRTEMAMYQAKSLGRNAICFFDPQLQSALLERRTLEHDMRSGLQTGQFELFYQPQVEMGRVIGAEALLRWKHPQKGHVPPAQFIPLAEETGFILPLGDWVLQAACHQLARWANHPRFGQLVLSVNVSPRQFHQSGFVDQVLKALAEHGADAHRLKLELTEGMLVADVDDTIAKMARLKSYGIGFSLDDFGTGYSSLAYLKRLPLDQLKIDRSFVRDVLTDPNDAAIARTIVALAKSLGLHVIAEGVETQAQCRFLEGVRCYAWQGYLMSPPLPVLEFERLVTNGNVPGASAPALSPSSMR